MHAEVREQKSGLTVHDRLRDGQILMPCSRDHCRTTMHHNRIQHSRWDGQLRTDWYADCAGMQTVRSGYANGAVQAVPSKAVFVTHVRLRAGGTHKLPVMHCANAQCLCCARELPVWGRVHERQQTLHTMQEAVNAISARATGAHHGFQTVLRGIISDCDSSPGLVPMAANLMNPFERGAQRL
jgi:hypothetical protein